MLTLTRTAADVVRALVAGAPVHDVTGGIRISSGEETPQGTPLELAFVDAPEAADEEIDAGGAHVFLEPRVFEGGFILTRAMDEPDHLPAQLAHVRHYLELLFGLSPEQPERGRRRAALA